MQAATTKTDVVQADGRVEILRTVHTDRGTTTTTTVIEGTLGNALAELGLDRLPQMGGELCARSQTVERVSGATVVTRSFTSAAERDSFMEQFRAGRFTDISQVIREDPSAKVRHVPPITTSTSSSSTQLLPSSGKENGKPVPDTKQASATKSKTKGDGPGPRLAEEMLAKHNELRVRHGAPPLRLSAELGRLAQTWADHLAEKGVFQHRPNNKFGENIYMQGGGDPTSAGVKAVESWYNEISKYKFGRDNFAPGTGHFTQVVWHDSSELGVGQAASKGRVFVVANYSPAGNVQGKFAANVRKPR